MRMRAARLSSSKSDGPARALRAGGLVRHSLACPERSRRGAGGLILLLGAAFAFASVARAAEEGQFLAIDISLDKTQYYRGTRVPVEDLFVRMSVSNTCDRENIQIHFARPRIGPGENVRFLVTRLSPPPGEDQHDPTAFPANVGQARILQGTMSDPDSIEETLRPNDDPAEFTLDVGRAFQLNAAGRYQLSATFEGATSTTLEFEILPLRRLDFRFTDFEQAIRTRRMVRTESGYPDYPYMFFIMPRDSRFDEIVYVKRYGRRGGRYNYQTYRLCRFPHRVDERGRPSNNPKIGVSGMRVAIAVEGVIAGGGESERRGPVDIYHIDLSARPVAVRRERGSTEWLAPPTPSP